LLSKSLGGFSDILGGFMSLLVVLLSNAGFALNLSVVCSPISCWFALLGGCLSISWWFALNLLVVLLNLLVVLLSNILGGFALNLSWWFCSQSLGDLLS
jgi:hypothetical protein